MSAAADIGDLGRRLWGDPNRKLSSKTEWRYGSHGSKCINPADGTWYDHEASQGGGFDDLYERVHGHRPITHPTIETTYDYHDADGILVYQVVRRAPKRFLQRRPDGKGGWVWNIKGTPRVLYRLPDLINAEPNAVIFVCEGEKDVDALHQRGMIATTNSGGAGKWQPNDSQYFRGRRVVILPDNDPQATSPDGTPRWHHDGRPVLPGQDHAADIAKSLQGIAAAVLVLMLPNLPVKGDVSDWLGAGGTADELLQLCSKAVEFEQNREWGADPSDGPADHSGARTEHDDEAVRAQANNENQAWVMPAIDLASNDAAPAPDLPLREVFPPRWAAWIEAAAESGGAPAGYVATALLAAAGALIGNARWANPWGAWKEPPAIDVALVGKPSSGKSPSLDALTDPLDEIQAADNEDWKERRRQHATEKAAAEERQVLWKAEVKIAVKQGNPPPPMPADAYEPEAPQRRRVFSTDPTIAKAERMSAANPRGLVLVRDELAGWLAGMDRFNNGSGSDRAFWLQAYGGRTWMPDRVKDGDAEIAVPHLLWGIVGGIQPDRLATLLLAGDDDGLSARFIYTWPAPRPPRRPRDDLVIPPAEEWLTRLRTLPWSPPEPLLVPFKRAAQDALQEWREEAARLEEGAVGLFLSWVGKLPGFAVRLALIFAHLAWCEHGQGDPPAEVCETDLLRAVTFLADYAVPMARRCFGEAALPQAERDARRLVRWLLRQNPLPGRVNARELRRMQDGPGIADAERVTEALKELAELRVVRPAPTRDGGPGRMRADWAVNPRLKEAHHGVG